MTQTLISSVLHITPKSDDLVLKVSLQCIVPGCGSVFKNAGNLQMHLEKHHNLQAIKEKETEKLFFCPQLGCMYHENSSRGKHFKCLKYLRQHFQKVHATKSFSCSKCSKGFATQSMLVSHGKNCGKKYTCAECGWSYNSSEALLTHAKRRAHEPKQKVEQNSGKVAIAKLKKQTTALVAPVVPLPSPPEPTNRETQTEKFVSTIVLPPKKRMKLELEVNHFQDTPLCDTETQTEINPNSGYCDPMLYSDMHTQTCDEFLSELGLADIQTQTNWSAIGEEDGRDSMQSEQYLSGAHDELMVSTETQTSFTQCLLDSCNEENSLSGCITQHTQTCDTLLEGLFGGQDNDFIGSFQSTHTQT